MRVVAYAFIGLLLVVAPSGVSAAESGSMLRDPALNDAYRAIYALDFAGAEQRLDAWQREHPGDAIGPVSRAANVLFRELDRLSILQSKVFQDDAFVVAARQLPDPALAIRFKQLLTQAEEWSRAALVRRKTDVDALFALTLVNGLRGDFTSLVEGRNMASLSYTREATVWAQRLLAVSPGCYDAYLASGLSHYIVGSLPAPVRWVLRLGGYSGDKTQGMREVQLTAQRGMLLAPFARILLAVAHLRDGDRAGARELLRGLQREFPSNPLFQHELQRPSAD